MPEAKDTLQRYITLLCLIPREPQRVATTVLHEKLRDRGFHVSLRSMQRDLIKLSGQFALCCDESETPYRWSFRRDAPLDLSEMDAPAALALHLSEEHLRTLLPQTVIDQLASQFRKARHYLEGLQQNGLADWSRRVRALPNGKTLIPAALSPDIWYAVSTALVERRQLQVRYASRSKAELKVFRIHPVGLVSRYSVSYLLGTVDDYTDLRQFAVHRMQTAEVLGDAATQPVDFNVDAYIEGGAFSIRQAPEAVELIADIHPQVAALLRETALSKAQTLTPLPDSEWFRLTARVPLDQETLWWIFGLNDNIRVHAPAVWVAEIRRRLIRMKDLYL